MNDLRNRILIKLGQYPATARGPKSSELAEVLNATSESAVRVELNELIDNGLVTRLVIGGAYRHRLTGKGRATARTLVPGGPEWPNNEHRKADEAARRRALACLDSIELDCQRLRTRIADGRGDQEDGRLILANAGQLTESLSILDTLRQVREWAEADKAVPGG